MKRMAVYVAVGAVLGTLLFTWLGPKMLGLWFQPPVNIGIDCHTAIQWAMNKLIVVQIVGLAVGIALGVVLAIAFRGRKEKL